MSHENIELRFKKAWHGWQVRIPDNIEYGLYIDNELVMDGMTSIIDMAEFYNMVYEDQPGELFLGPYTDVSIEKHADYISVVVNNSRIDDPINIVTSFSELEDVIGDFLFETFESINGSTKYRQNPGQISQYDGVNKAYKRIFG